MFTLDSARVVYTPITPSWLGWFLRNVYLSESLIEEGLISDNMESGITSGLGIIYFIYVARS